MESSASQFRLKTHNEIYSGPKPGRSGRSSVDSLEVVAFQFRRSAEAQRSVPEKRHGSLFLRVPPKKTFTKLSFNKLTSDFKRLRIVYI